MAVWGTCLGTLERGLVKIHGVFPDFKGNSTYEVSGGVLLLGDKTARALGSVQGTLALDDDLAGLSACSAELAADLGGAFPVRHFGMRLDLVVWVVEFGRNRAELGKR